MRKFSERIVYWLFGRQHEYQDKKEIYQYGMMLLLTSVCGMLSILLLSCLLFDIVDGTLFLIIFCCLRAFTGGYHCKTYFSCFLFSNLIFLLTAVLAMFSYRVNASMAIVSIALMACTACLYICKNAPITVSQRRLSRKKFEKNRKSAIALSMIISIITIVVAVLLYHNSTALHLCTLVAITEISVSVLMLIQKTTERRNNHA